MVKCSGFFNLFFSVVEIEPRSALSWIYIPNPFFKKYIYFLLWDRILLNCWSSPQICDPPGSVSGIKGVDHGAQLDYIFKLGLTTAEFWEFFMYSGVFCLIRKIKLIDGPWETGQGNGRCKACSPGKSCLGAFTLGWGSTLRTGRRALAALGTCPFQPLKMRYFWAKVYGNFPPSCLCSTPSCPIHLLWFPSWVLILANPITNDSRLAEAMVTVQPSRGWNSSSTLRPDFPSFRHILS